MYCKQSRVAKSKPNGTLYYSIQESSAHKLKNKTTEESSNDKLSGMSNVGSLSYIKCRVPAYKPPYVFD